MKNEKKIILIDEYFDEINSLINSFLKYIKEYTHTEKKYSKIIGIIKGEIVFNDNSQLSFMEFKNVETGKKYKYTYHFMTNKNTLIFRYDNAQHYPELATFPNHKHQFDKVIESSEPKLIDILLEIIKLRNLTN